MSFLESGGGIGFGVPNTSGGGVVAGPAYNILPNKLIHLRVGLYNAFTGAAQCKILCVGDSTTRGYGAGPDGLGFPADMATMLNSRGLPAQKGLIIPEFSRGSQTADTRIVYGTGWSPQSALNAGGWGNILPYWSAASGAAGTMVFTPGTLWNAADIYFVSLAGASSCTATVTSGTPGTVNGNQAQAIRKLTVTTPTPSTANTLTFSTVTAGSGMFIIGVEPYNTVTPSILVGNCGVNASSASGWANTADFPSGPLDCIKAYAPNLSIIDLGINDATATVTPASFFNSLAAIVAACQVSGDVLIKSMVPSGVSAAHEALEAQYVIQEMGFGLPMYDTFNRLGGINGYATYNPLGYYFDTEHPNLGGYAEEANGLTGLVFNV